jgi:D-alanyl-D-alanine carboxypeptidase
MTDRLQNSRGLFHKNLFWCLSLLIVLSFFPASFANAGRYAAIVIDAKSGKLLHGKNQDARVYPASLTKMMTLYLLLEAMEKGDITLNTKITVPRHATLLPNFKLGVRAGSKISVKYAVAATMVKSANDMAAAIGAHLGGGSEVAFAQMMTRKARDLGMTNTTFRNASGVPDKLQVTTARDMAILSRALYKRFPNYAHFYGIESFSFNGYHYRNSNKLLGVVQGVDGIKTGYTRAAGFNLAASAYRNGHRVIAVVMGTKSDASRNDRMSYLIEAGFTILQSQTKMPGTLEPPGSIPEDFFANNLNESESPELMLAQNDSQSSDNPSIPDDYFLTTEEPADVIEASIPPQQPKAIKKAEIQLASNEISTPTQARSSKTAAKKQKKDAVSPRAKTPEIKLAKYEAPSSETQDGGVVPAVAKKGDWGIQVGAYRSSKEAFKAATSALAHIKSSAGEKVRVSVSPAPRRSKVYRARLLGFDKKQATAVCKIMSKKGSACLPIQAGRSPKLYTAMN